MQKPMIVRNKAEIEWLLQWAEEGPHQTGESYEQGVRDALPPRQF